METAREHPEGSLEQALTAERAAQALGTVDLRIGQQVRGIFTENRSNISISVPAPGEGVAQSLMHSLETATSLSSSDGRIVWKSHPQHRVTSIRGSLHAAFEIRSSLLRITNEDGKNRDEENIALQVWESAPDEICLLTVGE
jgi:hypothetical protein